MKTSFLLEDGDFKDFLKISVSENKKGRKQKLSAGSNLCAKKVSASIRKSGIEIYNNKTQVFTDEGDYIKISCVYKYIRIDINEKHFMSIRFENSESSENSYEAMVAFIMGAII